MRNELKLLFLLKENMECFNVFSEKLDVKIFYDYKNSQLFNYLQKLSVFNNEFSNNYFTNNFDEKYVNDFENCRIDFINEKDIYKTISNLINNLVEKYNKNKLKNEIEKINEDITKDKILEFNELNTLIKNFENKTIDDEEFENDFSKNIIKEYENIEETQRDFHFNTSINHTFEGGMDKGEVMYLAGASGMFKTSYAINLLIEHALKDKKCVFFSLEMPKKQIFDNIFSILFNETLKQVKFCKSLTQEKIEIINKINDNIIVIDYASVSVFSIHKTIKQIKMKKKVDMLFVDHLNILNFGKLDDFAGLTEATKQFKNIAKEEKIACIILTQLNRDLKARKDKRPVLSDLRGSNTIAQDADFVYMLYREEYYYRENGRIDECPDLLKNKLEGYFAKSRRGESSKQIYQLNLSTKKVIKELDNCFVSQNGEIIDEIKQYKECLENNSCENKENKKVFFGKSENEPLKKW